MGNKKNRQTAFVRIPSSLAALLVLGRADPNHLVRKRNELETALGPCTGWSRKRPPGKAPGTSGRPSTTWYKQS